MIDGVEIKKITEEEVTRLEPSNVVKVPLKFMEGVTKYSLENEELEEVAKEVFPEEEPTVEGPVVEKVESKEVKVEETTSKADMASIEENLKILKESLSTKPGELMKEQTEAKIALFEAQLNEIKKEKEEKEQREKDKKIETLEMTLGTPYGKLMHDEILKELEKLEKDM